MPFASLSMSIQLQNKTETSTESSKKHWPTGQAQEFEIWGGILALSFVWPWPSY